MAAREEKWGKETVREFGIDGYTLLYFKWITIKDLLYSSKNSAEYSVKLKWEKNLKKNRYICN